MNKEKKIPHSEFPLTITFCTKDYSEETKTVPCPHDELKILLVHTGSANLHLQKTIIPFHTGQAVFINRHVPYGITAGEEDLTYYEISFTPEFLFDSTQPALTAKYLIPVLNDSKLHIIPFSETSSTGIEILSILKEIIACYLSEKFGCELYVKSRLYQFWYKLLLLTDIKPASFTAASTFSATAFSTAADDLRMKRALQFIETNYKQPISLNDISAYIHVSKSECCRCFKRSLGMTPFEYLLKYRIYISTLKLRDPANAPVPIAELAAASGIENTSYYNKLFKKYMLCTPGEYRKKNGELPDPEISLLAGGCNRFHPEP